MIGLGTFGIVTLQAAAAFAIVAFFRRRPDGHWLRTGVAPQIAGLVLTSVVVLTAVNFNLLTNSDSPWLNALPAVYLLAAVGGICYATYLRARRREIYDGIAGDTMRTILVGPAETAPGAPLGPQA